MTGLDRVSRALPVQTAVRRVPLKLLPWGLHQFFSELVDRVYVIASRARRDYGQCLFAPPRKGLERLPDLVAAVGR